MYQDQFINVLVADRIAKLNADAQRSRDIRRNRPRRRDRRGGRSP